MKETEEEDGRHPIVGRGTGTDPAGRYRGCGAEPAEPRAGASAVWAKWPDSCSEADAQRGSK